MTEKAQWEASRDEAMERLAIAKKVHDKGYPDLAQIGAMIGLGELLSALMEQNRAHHAELLAAIDEVL